ncbi:hypothetical protein [Dyella choica]|uniref:Uncharacterized protein n=1 Tax=Dyella choica TaxID=1927959 RepID=A0A3S0R1A2_9GAMM|nr:hypothetical protein [Dyella choica]RUL71065.1 hypothetical protein EKH80_19150 [Dyella choica]
MVPSAHIAAVCSPTSDKVRVNEGSAMKASRLNKLMDRLEQAEAILLNELRSILPRVAESGEPLFFHPDFLPDAKPHWLSKEGDALFGLAKETVMLREEAGLPVLGAIGHQYLSACTEAANVNNPHRRGPRQLAIWLLGEVGQWEP